MLVYSEFNVRLLYCWCLSVCMSVSVCVRSPISHSTLNFVADCYKTGYESSWV